jgi:hypothetical protein
MFTYSDMSFGRLYRRLRGIILIQINQSIKHQMPAGINQTPNAGMMHTEGNWMSTLDPMQWAAPAAQYPEPCFIGLKY